MLLTNVDWTTRKRIDPPCTLCGKYGFLAYCKRCGQPFATRKWDGALDGTLVCDDCPDHSKNLIPATAFSPDRKQS